MEVAPHKFSPAVCCFIRAIRATRNQSEINAPVVEPVSVYMVYNISFKWMPDNIPVHFILPRLTVYVRRPWRTATSVPVIPSPIGVPFSRVQNVVHFVIYKRNLALREFYCSHGNIATITRTPSINPATANDTPTATILAPQPNIRAVW